MTTWVDETQRVDATQQRAERPQTVLYRRVMRSLSLGFTLSVSLMLIGVIVAIARGEEIGDETDALQDILPAAADLEAQGIIDLGIVLLIATPLLYVVASLFTFLRQRDLVFVGVCLALLAILATSVGAALL